MDELDRKREILRGELEATGGLMVAFSGGVDSSLLLAAAAEALGPRAVAATGVSPSLAASELDAARAIAAELGVRHVVVPTHEQDRPGYLVNGPDRCYFCKSELYDRLAAVAARRGYRVLLSGIPDAHGRSGGKPRDVERGVPFPTCVLPTSGMKSCFLREFP